MAYSIHGAYTNTNGGFMLATGRNLIYANDTAVGSAGIYKYRYLMEVTYHTQGDPAQTKTITITQQPNSENQAIFDLTAIFKSIITPQITTSKRDGGAVTKQYQSIHHLPTGTPVSTPLSKGLLNQSNGMDAFRGCAQVINLKFFQMYSSTPTGVPVKIPTGGTGNLDVDCFVLWGRATHTDRVNIDFSDYVLKDGKSLFLSSNYNTVYSSGGIPNVYIDIANEEYHTISCLNRCAVNINAENEWYIVEYYDASGTNLGYTQWLNNTLNNGSFDVTTADSSFYQIMGVGLRNLYKLIIDGVNVLGVKPTLDGKIGSTVISSYKFYANSTASGNSSSIYYWFNVVRRCDKYENLRFSYMNKFGAWEYITLQKEVDRELKVKKDYIHKPAVINYAGNVAVNKQDINTAYPLQVPNQGKMAVNTEATIELKVFTDNLDSPKLKQIEDMMMSPQIHILYEDSFNGDPYGSRVVAVTLKNSKMRVKSELNRGVESMELTFEYANPYYSTT
tara:strand:+ start:4740 stop:6254 length:1515 start_codon:yes stop_codon:yes gene_type:complete